MGCVCVRLFRHISIFILNSSFPIIHYPFPKCRFFTRHPVPFSPNLPQKRNQMSKHIFLSLACLLLSIPLLAQIPVMSAAHKEALSKLDFMAGEWVGSGWMFTQAGKKETFEQTENIQWKLDGAVLMIEGQGKKEGKVVHDALAIISYDPSKEEYAFRSYLANGRSGDYKAKVLAENTLEWMIEAPGRTITYIITINEKGQWYEKGMMKMGDRPAFQFFEMTLDKK